MRKTWVLIIIREHFTLKQCRFSLNQTNTTPHTGVTHHPKFSFSSLPLPWLMQQALRQALDDPYLTWLIRSTVVPAYNCRRYLQYHSLPVDLQPSMKRIRMAISQYFWNTPQKRNLKDYGVQVKSKTSEAEHILLTGRRQKGFTLRKERII